MAGCSRHAPKPSTGDTILQWVPFKTSTASAQQIMEHHNFTCSVVTYTNADQMSNDADVNLWGTSYREDGRSLVVTNVSHLECERPHCKIRFTLVNGATWRLSVGGGL